MYLAPLNHESESLAVNVITTSPEYQESEFLVIHNVGLSVSILFTTTLQLPVFHAASFT